MANDRNIGANSAIAIYGSPEQFRRVIKYHGQLCKIKQGLPCACTAENGGTPKMHCKVCHGVGLVFCYQRRFLVADEYSPSNHAMTEIYPYYEPVMEVTKVQVLSDPKGGGIRTAKVTGFNDKTIFIENKGQYKEYNKRRVTYFFDGWTKVEGDVLKVNEKRGLMWPTKTFFDAGYQSSNPLEAEADICEMIRVYNKVTGKEVKDYVMIGNMIKTSEKIVEGEMVADYYFSDLTQVITADLKTANPEETWTRDMEEGDIRFAMYPWWNIGRGDLLVIAADAQYRDELLTHTGELDQLWELEIFELNDVIFDGSGNKYYRGTDYELEGRHIAWISDNQPKLGAVISVRYGFKPTFICFHDNPEPNNLENRRYPKIIFAKRWSKATKNDICKLLSNNA